MPLHLLSKKSWNVYNSDNIARVRRDEAEARAKSFEDLKATRNDDAAQRLAILRGDEPNIDASKSTDSKTCSRAAEHKCHGKKRKLAGENDTDRDMRLASQQEPSLTKRHTSRPSTQPLFDTTGHIDLLGREPEKKDRKSGDRGLQEQSEGYSLQVRNSGIVGRDNASASTWYMASREDNTKSTDIMDKDVWGNQDPRRAQRAIQRTNADDPLAAMKRGVQQLKTIEKERSDWKSQRERDLEEVEQLARQHEKSRSLHRKRRHSEPDSLDDFKLDDAYNDEDRPKSKRQHRHHYRHHRRHRSRSPSRPKHRDRT